jgi:hypothetical protein
VGIRGIAARTSELFKSKYKVYYVADADSYSYQSTQIRCKSENPDIMKAAEEIKSILRTGTINIQTGTQVSDIVIIIGRDYASGGTSNTGSGSADISTGPVLVNVLNGQGTPGIAAKVKIEIETYTRNNGNGIKVTEAKNASSFGYRNTRIIIFTSRDGVNESAENLKKLLGVGDILKSAYNVDNVDITVVLGNDYRK